MQALQREGTGESVMKTSTGKILKFAEDTEGELLQLPLQMLMQTIFLGGNKGSGKTSSMKRLFEAAYAAGAQCGVIAPLGRWWSLRIAKNGKSSGLKKVFIFGGKHADVPIDASSGQAVARIVTQKRLHFVLDVELMRKKDRIQFVADFLEELWQLKKEEDASHPMVVFIDEAQTVAPQKTRGDDAERMKEAAADLCREGRNHGVGMVLSAQRSANVDKDLLALVEMLIVMRTIHHLDRKVYQSWVDEKGDVDEDEGAWLKKLRRLQKGEAYIYAPELNIFERVKVLMPDTYDATATAVLGEKVARIGKLSKLDVKKLGEELTKVVQEAAANDPEVMRSELERLQQLVKQHELGHSRDEKWEENTLKPLVEFFREDASAGQFGDDKGWSPVQSAVYFLKKWRREAMLAKELKGGAVKQLKPWLKKMEKYNVDFKELLSKFDRQRDRLAQAQQVVVVQMDLLKLAIGGKLEVDIETAKEFPFGEAPGQSERQPGHPLIPPGRYTVKPTAVKLMKTNRVKGAIVQTLEVTNSKHAGAVVNGAQTSFKLVGKMVDMLRALEQKQFNRSELATVIGMAPGSGGFNNYLGALKTAGLVVTDNNTGLLTLSPEGFKQAHEHSYNAPYPLDLNAVVARHGSAIVGKMRDMVNAVTTEQRQYGRGLSRDALAQHVSMAPGSGGFNNYVGALKSRGIFVYEHSALQIHPVLR